MKTGVSFSLFIGALAFLVGFLLLFAPSALRKLNEFSAKAIAKFDSATFSNRIGFGVSLLITSAFMFFMAYYFSKRY